MRSYLFIFQLLLIPFLGLAQAGDIAAIESAIDGHDFAKAKNIWQNKLQAFKTNHQADSIVEYIFVAGKIYVSERNIDQGNKAVEELITLVKSWKPHDSVLKQAYIESGEYYGFTGDNKKGYQYNTIASQYASKAGSSPSKLALIENNLATFAQRSGNMPLAKKHSLNAIRLLENTPDPNFTTLYIAQNGLGVMAYYASQLDSAVYYYEEALKSLSKSPQTPINQFYRVAVLKNNLAGIYSQQGSTGKAIDAMYAVINNLERYYASPDLDPRKKSSALSFQYEATDNLGGLYRSIGDLTRARDLLEYSYNQKIKNLPENNRGIFNSQILLGQLYHAMGEQEIAIQKTSEGIDNFVKSGSPDPIWVGDGFNTLAQIYENRGNASLAKDFYNRADSCYLEGMGGVYDEIYLEFLRNKSGFLAASGNHSEAMKVSDRSYRYILDTEGRESFNAFYQLLNFSQVEYLGKNYVKSEEYASKGLNWLDGKIREASMLVDSVKMEAYKPKAIYYRERARHELLPQKTEAGLKEILKELQQALEIIDRKKSFVSNAENNRAILSENKEIFDFVKKVELELYSLTNDQSYIDRIVNLQESFLYTKLRSRLNDDSARFAHIPESVRLEEQRLNQLLDQSFKEDDLAKSIRDFKQVSYQIESFRKTLKNNYPDYYRLRYESFLSEERPVQDMVPSGTSLVRYFFIDSALFALVSDNEVKKIVPLQIQNLKQLIEQTTLQTGEVAPVADALFELYEMLWKPIKEWVRNKKVIVIPDGILFNLNIEILTPEKIRSYNELAEKSLLADYTFSYNYSIFLLQNKNGVKKYAKSFRGFAPGFSESLKKNYRQMVDDPVRVDYSYMNMLPQPFTTSLVKQLHALFGGKVYLERESTKKRFVNDAGNTEIIHIGTHAFSDNQFPQYSRLVFTKDDAVDENNNLYVSDIYNYELPSELMVLSACETGKPGYEDGEGMISLAHAFNYAGSSSILTSLWKIDEKASAILLEGFYKNLRKGMDKDEALRLAKLSYLKSEKNRMLYPAYWAGLVVIGDTSPVGVSSSSQIATYMLVFFLLALLAFGGYTYFVRRKSGKEK